MAPRTLAQGGLSILIGLVILGHPGRGARADGLDRMIRVLSAPGGAKITHGIASRSPLSFHTAVPSERITTVTAGERRTGRDWANRFLQALGLPGALESVRDTCPRHDPAVADRDSARTESALILVVVGDPRDSVWCEFRFEDRRVVLRDSSGTCAWLPLNDRAPAVLELLREALPHDRRLAEVPVATAADTPVAPCRCVPPADDSAEVETLPEILHRVPPDYPYTARADGVQGRVLVMALIDLSGHVVRTAITGSVPELDEAAVRAVEKWRFSPATADGRAVKVWVTIPVSFTLHDR
jgi:TonB family protein